MGWFSRRRSKADDPADHGGGADTAADLTRTVATASLGATVDPATAERVAAYVTHGTSPDVLSELGEAPADRLDQRDELTRRLGEMTPEVALRWAKVLDLCQNSRPYGRLDPINGSRWLDSLLAAKFRLRDGLQLDVATVVAMARADGANEEDLLRVLLIRPILSYSEREAAMGIAHLANLGSWLSDRADVVGRLVAESPLAHRIRITETLRLLTAQELTPYAATVATLVTNSSSQLRSAALPLVARLAPDHLGALRDLARTGSAPERLSALTVLWQHLDDPGSRGELLELARADRAPSVKALADRWDAVPDTLEAAPTLVIPELGELVWSVEWSPELAAKTYEVAARIRERSEADELARERWAQQWADDHGGTRPPWYRPGPGVPDDLEERLHRAIVDNRPPQPRSADVLRPVSPDTAWIGDFAGDPAVSWPTLIKLLSACDVLLAPRSPTLIRDAIKVLQTHHSSTGTGSFLELEQIFDAMALPGRDVVFSAELSYPPLGPRWSDEARWPFVATHLDRLLELVAHDRRDWPVDQDPAYALFDTLPVIPEHAVLSLLDIAVGSRKHDRVKAQLALRNVPGIDQRAAAALRDGKGETRAAAAAWLGGLGNASVVPLLVAAAATERGDLVKGVMLDALEALGQPAEANLDHEQLARDAALTLTKPRPKELAWFPWEALPEVRWQASGEPVSRDVLIHLIVSTCRGKTPEPGAMLRRWVALWEPRGRQAFASFVLDAWMAADLAPISADEALVLATQAATQWHGHIRRNPSAFEGDPRASMTLPELVARELPGYARMPRGSESASRGVLAMVAAAGGGDVVGPSGRYLREWYGQRAAQGRSLIGMLAWVEDSGATQLVLSIASRFRTKGFQDEAAKQIQAMAERKGWTLAELTDRTVPTCGFDSAGTLELSYGDRTFTGRLQPDLSVVLYNPDGTVIKSLPQPRSSDDEDAVTDAKRALARARKELKAISTLQGERLYEALCTERTWAATDWQTYVAGHPLVRLLAQQLVWRALDPGHLDEPALTFRPLDDGTLTDVEDGEVILAPGALVSLAHETNIGPALARDWERHLTDYEVSPLFTQFGHDAYVLGEAAALTTEIGDFRGHQIESFQLRGRAGKLGYVRGAPADGGWFYDYVKRFPTLGIAAVIEFSGNSLPEQQRTVALTGLHFERSGTGGLAGPMTLGDVPALLLSEAYHDLRLLAATGTGFNPDWEREVSR